MFGACSVIEREKQLVLSIRLKTPYQDLPKTIGESYHKIHAYMKELVVIPVGAPFVGYFNMDMDNLDVEIGFPVSKELPGKGEIKFSQIPSGKYATMIYTGPYNEMKEAYRGLSNWMEAHQVKSNYLAYEVYLNDPAEVAESDLETQILLGVE